MLLYRESADPLYKTLGMLKWFDIVAFGCLYMLNYCYLMNEYIMNGDMRVQAYSECVVSSHPEWQECSLNGRGVVTHDDTSIKARARWLTDWDNTA